MVDTNISGCSDVKMEAVRFSVQVHTAFLPRRPTQISYRVDYCLVLEMLKRRHGYIEHIRGPHNTDRQGAG